MNSRGETNLRRGLRHAAGIRPEGGARAFVDTAPLDKQGRAKLGHLNAERSLKTS
ncbi:hypothetical protein ACGFZU_22470 [Streptomyces tendae]|uniref:hypothetical protein n=1 Tax=Streptomyces tendae TaxID=1932 RepID=UPI00371E98E7